MANASATIAQERLFRGQNANGTKVANAGGVVSSGIDPACLPKPFNEVPVMRAKAVAYKGMLVVAVLALLTAFPSQGRAQRWVARGGVYRPGLYPGPPVLWVSPLLLRLLSVLQLSLVLLCVSPLLRIRRLYLSKLRV
jgi:hypothetical protein